ncbi:hypothetical protein HDV05_005430 [Chytridiales sp. JEL 0842]|nr:hypothetical protein HDV05_005430 [Chytridiales sp. JEL 0842]
MAAKDTLMQLLRLDVEYLHAEGDYIYHNTHIWPKEDNLNDATTEMNACESVKHEACVGKQGQKVDNVEDVDGDVNHFNEYNDIDDQADDGRSTASGSTNSCFSTSSSSTNLHISTSPTHRAHNASTNPQPNYDGFVKVLDCVGGYGSTMIGHNHPRVKQVLLDSLASNIPFHAQVSKQSHVVDLEKALNECIQNDFELINKRSRTIKKIPYYKLTIANTGTEAVEAAIKHAKMVYYERLDHLTLQFGGPQLAPQPYQTLQSLLTDTTKGPVLMHISGSFHGKTAGALAVNGNETYKSMYTHQLLQAVELKREATLQEIESLFAKYAVKIPTSKKQINTSPTNEPLPEDLAKVARRFGVPIVCDEVQTGMFRTGPFLGTTGLLIEGASEECEVWMPEYILLGKSLGGGISKISAMLVQDSIYQSSFSVVHTSTFANDPHSTLIALETLRILSSDPHLSHRALQFQNAITTGFQKLQQLYPNILPYPVRGRGFMMGIQFHLPPNSYLPNFLETLASYEAIGYFLASYLLHRHQIRVAAALSCGTTLRLEPSGFVDIAEASKRVLEGVGEAARLLNEMKIVDLSAHVWRFSGDLRGSEVVCEKLRRGLEAQEPDIPVVSFLFNAASVYQMKTACDVYKAVSELDLKYMLENVSWLTPKYYFTAWEQVIHSFETPNGPRKCLVKLINVPLSSYFMEKHLRAGSFISTAACRDAVLQESRKGVPYIGLGAFTSIVLFNGTVLPHTPNVVISTGNSLTAASAVQSILKLISDRKLDPANLKLGVVGSAGNICSICTELLVGVGFGRGVVMVHRERLEESARFQRAVRKVVRALERKEGKQEEAEGKSGEGLTAFVDGRRGAGKMSLSGMVGHFVANPGDALTWYLDLWIRLLVLPLMTWWLGMHPKLVRYQIDTTVESLFTSFNKIVSSFDFQLKTTATKPTSDAKLDARKSAKKSTTRHSKKPLENLQNLMLKHRITCDSTITPTTLQDCDVILVGTNSSRILLTPSHFKQDAIILDISVPSNLPRDILLERPDLKALVGGYMVLPHSQRVLAGCLESEKDTFACLSESIAMGLMQVTESVSVGPLTKEGVVEAWKMAKGCGMELGTAREIG